jgi:hypothetical protein
LDDSWRVVVSVETGPDISSGDSERVVVNRRNDSVDCGIQICRVREKRHRLAVSVVATARQRVDDPGVSLRRHDQRVGSSGQKRAGSEVLVGAGIGSIGEEGHDRCIGEERHGVQVRSATGQKLQTRRR